LSFASELIEKGAPEKVLLPWHMPSHSDLEAYIKGNPAPIGPFESIWEVESATVQHGTGAD